MINGSVCCCPYLTFTTFDFATTKKLKSLQSSAQARIHPSQVATSAGTTGHLDRVRDFFWCSSSDWLHARSSIRVRRLGQSDLSRQPGRVSSHPTPCDIQGSGLLNNPERRPPHIRKRHQASRNPRSVIRSLVKDAPEAHSPRSQIRLLMRPFDTARTGRGGHRPREMVLAAP